MRKPHYTIPPIIIIILLIAYYLISSRGGANVPQTGSTNNPQAATQPGGAQPSGAHVFGKQTRTSGCVSQNALPDPGCTPGAILETNLTKICASGYAGSVRNVTTSEKDQVYASYGITSHAPGQYEVDHLVSLELGGSNEIANLWPEPASPTPGFHQKDQVENYLHDQVCSGKMTLLAAQTAIATNWIAVYNQMPK